ncbi:MAG: DNA gyrase/topoisomerase IV subunit A [Verrucomicrobiales bacterium]|nr:DNA gyrase/topoisomerase IV subunit A [Verrucomicrobiales bacterium]
MPEPTQNPLKGMYSDWFLDYASYVILERAVPHINDGLKPVQRRILHSLKEKDDGRFNKVANIIGHTMQYHPHGDQAIGDALVNMGQKELVVDTQGNWGNILTGDSAAAPRYIETRLSKFANEVLFNPKTTTWAASYDGRNKEPVTLPAKFPLVLAHGAEGIAVGLACKILPHNFNELIDACISVLRKEEFEIFPDFIQGGIADMSDYNDGLRGGRIRVRARIERVKARQLVIREIPFGTTATSLCDSILKANEQGKVRVSRLEDCTAENVEIHVYLPAGVDTDQTLQALYAFTDCEVSISPNACVIQDNKPRFLGVSEILKHSAKQTRELLKQELEIKLGELQEKWHFSSLEKIFIEKRIYRRIEECETWEAVIEEIWEGLRPYLGMFLREVTEEDIVRLTEIKIKRISKFDSFKADEFIRGLEDQIKETKKHLRRLTQFTIKYYESIKERYGKGRERKTEISTFDRVEAKQVVVANDTLYVNRKEGMAGYGMKRDEAVEKCSRLDDIIAFSRDGTMRVVKVADKVFIGKDNLIVHVFNKEQPKFYNMIYRDGRGGRAMAKRFQVSGVTREKLYDLTAGKAGTRVLWLSEHDTEEDANIIVRVHLKSDLGLRKLQIDFRFADLGVKGRGARGNILTKNPVDRVSRIPKSEQEEIEGKTSSAPPESAKKPEPPKKAATRKKAPSKKAAPKKAPSQKSVAGKPSPKKKTAARKASPPKPATRKSPAKKAASKKKSATRKTSAKKKSASKKATRKRSR